MQNASGLFLFGSLDRTGISIIQYIAGNPGLSTAAARRAESIGMYEYVTYLFSFYVLILWMVTGFSAYGWHRAKRPFRKAFYASAGLVAPIPFMLGFAFALRGLLIEPGMSLTVDDVPLNLTGPAIAYLIGVALWFVVIVVARQCSVPKGRIVLLSR
jgi:hypothetical protein